MRETTTEEPGDGAGAPPWLPILGTWFLAAAVLLALPRMWIPATLCGVIGGSLRLAAARRPAGARVEPPAGTDVPADATTPSGKG
ncbi:MAG: hypothetical protein FJ095_03420 [Deltaproteobacteria bacterium]|nr:hypothetical protein [Deltaproteobacteria bacterium]